MNPHPLIARPRCGSAAAEQAWNEQHVAQPVHEPIWRVWTYRERGVVLGCSQRGLLAAVRDDASVPLLMRESGGGAVLTGPWLVGLSVALPPDHALVAGGPVASYRWLGELIAGLLCDANVAAHALPPQALRANAEPAPEVARWACFGGLSPWEVVVGDRKIAGLAQVRRRHAVLLVGGILFGDSDWPLLCALVGRPVHEAGLLAARTTSCSQQRSTFTSTAALAAGVDQRLRQRLQALPAQSCGSVAQLHAA